MTNALIAFQEGWKVLRREGPGQIQFWFIALAIGIVAGFTALFFAKVSMPYNLFFMVQMMCRPYTALQNPSLGIGSL